MELSTMAVTSRLLPPVRWRESLYNEDGTQIVLKVDRAEDGESVYYTITKTNTVGD